MQPFRVVVSDPPWQFGDSLPGESRGASKNYEVLGLQGICDFTLPPLEEEGAVLFLWRVSSMVEEAYSVIRAWDFVPKSEIVWQKLTKNGLRHFGMGRYVRATHETCVIATRGRCFPKVKNVRSTFEAPLPLGEDGKPKHSAKPEEFYKIVEEMYDGPYLEMFARKRRKNWTSWGNEVE